MTDTYMCTVCGEEASEKDPASVPRDEYASNATIHRDQANDVQYVHYRQ